MGKLSPKSRLNKWLIRVAGSALLLGGLFWYLPHDAILTGLRSVPPLVFLAVFAAFLASHVMAAAKWWLVLGRPCGFLLALRAHFGGLAANLCLPGSIGGDAVRATMIHGAMRNAARLTAGALADRVIDLLALVMLSGIGVLLMGKDTADLGLLTKVAGAFAALSLVLVVVLPMALPRLWALFPNLPGRTFVLAVSAAFGQLARNPGLLIFVQLASLAIQGCLVLLAYKLALAVGLQVDLGAWIFAWPLAKLISILPISLGGLGLREATLAALLVPFGAIGAQVVAAGLIWQAVLFLTGGLGGVIVLLSRDHAKQAVAAKDLSS